MIAPLQKKTMPVRKKMKTSTGSPFNSTSLLENPIVSVPSNGVTNNLKKRRSKEKKRLKSFQIFANLEFDYLTPQCVKRS